MEGKKSFLLYKDLHETVKELDDAEAANLLRAIFRYQNDEPIGDVDRGTKLIMKQLEQTFKREDNKWDSIRDRNAKNGKKGGRPIDNPENPVGYLGTQKTQRNPKEPRKAVSVTDTVIVPEKDKKVSARKARAHSLREIQEYCASIGLPESDGEATWDKWEGNGHKNAGKAMKCWKATIRSWKANGYMPSQKYTNNKHNPVEAEIAKALIETPKDPKTPDYVYEKPQRRLSV